MGLPVYRGFAPETATFPCLVFRRQGGTDVMNLQGTYMVRSIWLVFVAARGDEQAESQQGVNAVEAHADALHDALVNQPITTQNGRVIADCLRESEFDSPVVESGVEYQRIGGVYRILSAVA